MSNGGSTAPDEHAGFDLDAVLSGAPATPDTGPPPPGGVPPPPDTTAGLPPPPPTPSPTPTPPAPTPEIERLKLLAVSKLKDLFKKEKELGGAQAQEEKFDRWYYRLGTKHQKARSAARNRHLEAVALREEYKERLEQVATEAGPGFLPETFDQELRERARTEAGAAAPAPTPYPTENEQDEPGLSEGALFAWQTIDTAFDTVTYIFGVDAPYVLAKYGIERLKVAGQRGDIENIVKAIRVRTGAFKTGSREEFEQAPEVSEQVTRLKKQIAVLKKEGRLRTQDESNILKEIQAKLDAYRTSAAPSGRALTSDIRQILGDYIQYKVTKGRLAKAAVNLAGFGIHGMMARGIGLLGLAAIERTAKEHKETVLARRAASLEGRDPEDVKFALTKVISKSWDEWQRSIRGKGATAEREGGSKWVKRIDRLKAIGIVLRVAGVGWAAASEAMDFSWAPSRAIKKGLEAIRERGLLDGVIHNYGRSWPWSMFAEEVPTGSAGSGAGAVAAEAAYAPRAPEARGVTAAFARTHHVLAERGFGVKLEGGKKVLEVALGQGNDYKATSHALLDLVGQETDFSRLAGGKTFDGIDGARALNAAANLKDLMRGELTNIEGLTPEKVREFLEVTRVGGKTMIKVTDYDGFVREVAKPLLTHARETVDEHSGALAWLRKLKDSRFEHIIEGRAQDLTTAGKAVRVALEDFDQSRIVRASEVRGFSQMVERLGLEGVDVDPQAVEYVDTGAFKMGNKVFHAVDGAVRRVYMTVEGVTYSHEFDAVGFDDTDADEKIKGAMTAVEKHVQSSSAGSARPPAGDFNVRAGNAGDTLAAGKAGEPAGFQEFLERMADRDGRVRLGQVRFEKNWLAKVEPERVARFIADMHHASPGDFSSNAQYKAYAALAEALEKAHAPGTGQVGKFLVENHQRLNLKA